MSIFRYSTTAIDAIDDAMHPSKRGILQPTSNGNGRAENGGLFVHLPATPGDGADHSYHSYASPPLSKSTDSTGASSSRHNPSSKLNSRECLARFQSALLQKVQRPDLHAHEVDELLLFWQGRLVETLHRWLHPGIWRSIEAWKAATLAARERHRAASFTKRLWLRRCRPALRWWRSQSRILAIGRPFLKSRLLFHAMHTWSQWATDAAVTARWRMLLPRIAFTRFARAVALSIQRRLGALRVFEHLNARRAFSTYVGSSHTQLTSGMSSVPSLTRGMIPFVIADGWAMCAGQATWRSLCSSAGETACNGP